MNGDPIQRMTLAQDIAAVLNKHGMESISNTSDCVLADYLVGCLMSFNLGVKQRNRWYGHECSIFCDHLRRE